MALGGTLGVGNGTRTGTTLTLVLPPEARGRDPRASPEADLQDRA